MTEKVVTLRIRGDSGSLVAEARASEAAIGNLAAGTDAAGTAARRGAAGMDRLAAGAAAAGAAARNSDGNLDQLGATAQRVGQGQVRGLSANLGALRDNLQRVGAVSSATGAAVRGSDSSIDRLGATAQRVAQGQVRGLSAELGALRDNLQRVGAFSVAGLGLVQSGRAIAEATNRVRGWEQALKAATGSQAGSAAGMQFLRSEADRLGISLSGNGDAFVSLTAATRGTALEGEQVRKIFSAISESARVLNLDAGTTAGALQALTQMVSKGSVQSEELRGQLGERLPGAFRIAAEAMGVTEAKLGKLLDSGQVTADQLLPRLADRLHALYGAAASEAANGPAAQMERLKNATFELLAAVGNSGVMDALSLGAQGAAAGVGLLSANSGLLVTTLGAVATAHGINSAASLVAAQRNTANAAATLNAARAAEAEALTVSQKASAVAQVTGIMGPAIAAENAYAAAQARTAAALEAATLAGVGKAGILTRLGSGLLAFAGGPVGVATLAVGGLAYAIYETVKAEQAHQRELAASLKAIDQSTTSLQNLHAQWQAVANAKPITLAEGMQAFAAGADTLIAKSKELGQTRAQLEFIEQRIQYAQQSTHDAAGLQLLSLIPKAEALRAEIAQQEKAVAGLQAAWLALGGDLAARLDPAFDQAESAVARLRRSLDVGSLLTSVGQGFSALATGANIATADAAAAKFFADLSTRTTDLNAKLRDAGKTQAQLAQSYVDNGLAAARAAGLSEELIAAKAREGAAYVAAAEKLDAANKKSGASNKGAASDAANYVASLREQVATFNATADGAARYELATRKLTAAQRAEATQLLSQLSAWQSTLRIADAAQKAWTDLAEGNVRLREQLAQVNDELAGLTPAQIAYNAAVREANELAAEALALGPPTAAQQEALASRLSMLSELRAKQEQLDQRQVANYGRLSSAAQDYGRRSGEVAASVFNDWRRLWDSGERRASAYWKSMVNMLERAVYDMLATWLQTRVIGMFGGGGGGSAAGGGWLGAAAGAYQAYAGGGGGGNSYGNAAMQIGQDYLTGGSGGGFNLFDSASWINAGQNLYTGFSQLLWGSGQTTTLGSYMGVANYGPGMTTTYTPTGAGAYAGYAAGIAGAYYGFTQRGNGGLSSAAAGLSYGALGMGAVGAIGGIASGAGAVAGATGAFASLGAAAWIPVVGWILAILALVDVVAGGRLFGTKPRVEYMDAALNLGPDGPSSTLTTTKVRQRSLFRGRDWDTFVGPGTPEMDEAAREFFDMIQTSMLRVARETGRDLAPMIEASLHETNKYDKRGKIIGTTYTATIRGKDYVEDKAEDAAARIQAEAILTQLGNAAVLAAEKWRDSVDTLTDVTALFVAVETDISNGVRLFGDMSLEAIGKAIEGYRQGEEAMVETYARLSSEVNAVRDAFALAGATLTKVGAELVQFAVDISSEAGGSQAAARLWQGFFQSFYSQAELAQRQYDVLKPQLTAGLAGIGLDADTTMEEFRSAFEAALPTLTAAQIVEWLKVGATLSQINQIVATIGGTAEQLAQKLAQGKLNYAQYVVGIEQQLIELSGGGMSNFQKTLAGVGQNLQNNIRTLNELARAAGLSAAREQDLARAHALAAAQAAQAARQLDATSRDLVARLYGGDTSIAGRAASAGSAMQSVADGIDSIQSAADRFRAGLLLDDQLSPLNAQQQLDEALRQLRATGSEEIGRRALDIGRRLMASGSDYSALFDLVTSLVKPSAGTSGDGVGSGAFDAAAIQPPAISPAERISIAQQIAQNLADLSGFSGDSYQEIAASWGLSLTQLGADLDLQGQQLIDYLDSLKASSYGLDDLATVISKQVDRIVAALNGDPQPLAPGTNAPPTTAPGPTVHLGKSAVSDSDGARAIVSAVDQMAARIESALLSIAAMTAGAGEATQAAVRDVADETRESVRELRRVADAVEGRGGYRTGGVV